jgi:hypothetical protein
MAIHHAEGAGTGPMSPTESVRDRFNRARRGRAPRRGRSAERGAVLVESALLMPFMLLLIFGIIEFSFALQSSAVLNDAARASGRAGASLAGEKGFGEGIAKVASSEMRNLPATATPGALVIYKANDKGYPGADGNTSFNRNTVWQCWLNANSTCVAGTWDIAQDKFTAPAGGWDAIDQDACAGTGETYANYDKIGVAIFIQYKPLLSMFNPFLKRDANLFDAPEAWNAMTEHAAFVFEPQPLGSC